MLKWWSDLLNCCISRGDTMTEVQATTWEEFLKDLPQVDLDDATIVVTMLVKNKCLTPKSVIGLPSSEVASMVGYKDLTHIPTESGSKTFCGRLHTKSSTTAAHGCGLGATKREL